MPSLDPWLLAIDIGNTQIVVGVLEKKKLHALYRLTSHIGLTADELRSFLEPLLQPYREEILRSRRVAIASVVPALTGNYEEYAVKRLNAHPTVVRAGLPIRLQLDVVDPSSVGADRIADAVAASELYDLPAIVVDLGTATTFDVVLPGPRYVGGVIAPGIVTSAEELFRRAARLARVEIRAPKRVVGRTTEESIQSGVLFGAAAQIDGIVGRISKELRIRPTVIATGGLAAVIAPHCRSLRYVKPALTLHGIRLIDEEVRAHARVGKAPSRAAQAPKKALRSRPKPT
jgi:type III pantothenate kinase